jgi:hypothetical protein
LCCQYSNTKEIWCSWDKPRNNLNKAMRNIYETVINFHPNKIYKIKLSFPSRLWLTFVLGGEPRLWHLIILTLISGRIEPSLMHFSLKKNIYKTMQWCLVQIYFPKVLFDHYSFKYERWIKIQDQKMHWDGFVAKKLLFRKCM